MAKIAYNNLWEHIFKHNNLNPLKYIQIITAKQIKQSNDSWKGEQNQFEPRLLAKMDTFDSRPEIFKVNNIFMISIENGKYALIKENIYIKLPKNDSYIRKIEKKTDSLILDIGNSEISMLDNLLYNGILTQLIGEDIKYGPLLGGRHRCSFSAKLGNETLNIKGSQYETDGCYETENYICIVEAKSIECTNFNIRQLYFPFREIYKKIGDKKKIIALFIYKDKKNIINIYKFKWNNPEIMLDIQCINYYKFIN